MSIIHTGFTIRIKSLLEWSKNAIEHEDYDRATRLLHEAVQCAEQLAKDKAAYGGYKSIKISA